MGDPRGGGESFGPGGGNQKRLLGGDGTQAKPSLRGRTAGGVGAGTGARASQEDGAAYLGDSPGLV